LSAKLLISNIADNIAGNIADNIVDYSAILLEILLNIQQYCWIFYFFNFIFAFCYLGISLEKNMLIFGHCQGGGPPSELQESPTPPSILFHHIS